MNRFTHRSSNDWKNNRSEVPMVGKTSAPPWWFLLLLLMLFGHTTFAQPDNRGDIVFVDFEQVFTNYYKTKLANEQLLEMSDAINRERAIMVAQFDQLQKDFKELRDHVVDPQTDESAKAEMRRKLDEKLIALRRQEEKISKYNQSQQKRWEEQNRRIRDNLVEEIQGKLSGYLNAKGYRAVVDSSQINEKNVPAVLFIDKKADITADVIAELNK